MAIYFDGFDDKMLSFYSESGRVGMLAYPVANKYVKECDSKSPNFMGFVRNVQGNLVGVQLGGYVECKFTGIAPTPGYCGLIADGFGGVKVDEEQAAIKRLVLWADATTGKSFTQALEQIDPSENYAGTPLEGLDAYQRQLKRFDIKVSGIGSDTVSKFFQTSDSAALFPEYVSRAVRQGMEQADVLQKIVATTTVIDGMDYRAIESVENGERLTAAEVAEGASLPTTTVQVKDTLTEMHKRGRMLVASYEAVKFQKLDLFTVTLRQIGNCIAEGQLLDAYAALIGVHDSGITLEGGLTYAGLVDLWNAFEGFNMTTLLVSARDTASILKMTEMQDAIAGNDFHATGRVVTPLGAELIKHKMFPDNTILALDRTCALEKVQAGDVVTDFDKLIDRQLERASITAIAGFSPIFSGAVQMLTHA